MSNIITKNFADFDKLDRKQFAMALTKAIRTFYTFEKGAYVVSLNAPYGSGKTTFLEMWQHYLENDLDEKHTVFYINAWKTDFAEDPIVPIVSAFIDNLEAQQSKTATVIENTKTALHKTLGAAALIANGWLEQKTGYNTKDIAENIEKDVDNNDLGKVGEAIFQQYHFKQRAHQELKEALEKYVASLEHKPLIILVDELDRVRPNYAIEFLEAIKHLFSVQGICFVLAVDKQQLENSTKKLYGEIDFQNYYRRFVVREVNLPTYHEDNVEWFIKACVDGYCIEDNNNIPQNENRFLLTQEEIKCIVGIASFFAARRNMNARQIEDYIRVSIHFLAINPYIDVMSKDSWCNYFSAVLFLIAASIMGDEEYHLIGKDNLTTEALWQYLQTQWNFPARVENGREFRIPLISICIYSIKENNRDVNDMVDIFHAFDNRWTVEDARELFIKDRGFWGEQYKNSGFQDIYNRLEKWRNFIE